MTRSVPIAWGPSAFGSIPDDFGKPSTRSTTMPPISQSQDRLVADAWLVKCLWDQADERIAQLAAIHEGLRTAPTGDAVTPPAHDAGGLGDEYAAVLSRIEVQRVASLVLGEARTAKARNVQLTLDHRSRLRELPKTLNETDAISVVGNLLQNAVDGVADVRPERRRVTCLLSDANEHMRVRVRDWGSGLGGLSDDALFSRGFTTKAGHSGLGLALVQRLVEGAGGTLAMQRCDVGAAFEVVIPNG